MCKIHKNQFPPLNIMIEGCIKSREEKGEALSLGSGEGDPQAWLPARQTRGQRHLKEQKGLSWQEHGVCREPQPKHELVGTCPSREVGKGKFMKVMQEKTPSCGWCVPRRFSEGGPGLALCSS